MSEVQEINEKNEFEELFIANLDKSNRFKEKIIKVLLLFITFILILSFSIIGYMAHQMTNGGYITTTETVNQGG